MSEKRACAHPVIETKAGGVGECMACGERVGLVEMRGQPVGFIVRGGREA